MKNFILSKMANIFLIIGYINFIANLIILFANCYSPIFGRKIVVPTIIYFFSLLFVNVSITKLVNILNKLKMSDLSLFFSVLLMILPLLGAAVIMFSAK